MPCSPSLWLIRRMPSRGMPGLELRNAIFSSNVISETTLLTRVSMGRLGSWNGYWYCARSGEVPRIPRAANSRGLINRTRIRVFITIHRTVFCFATSLLLILLVGRHAEAESAADLAVRRQLDVIARHRA